MATLSNDKTYVTVTKGDTLSQIAVTYKKESGGKTYQELAKLNNIPNPNYIVVGQKIKLTGAAAKVPSNTTSKVDIQVFGLQSNTDRTVYAFWTWDRSNTKEYQVKWFYTTGDGVRFIGSESTVTSKQATYTAPANAKKVVFRVKPVSKTRTVNKKETTYWTASWSTDQIYDFANNPPTTPPVPSVTIDKKLNLTASLDNINVNASIIQFEVVKNDSTSVKKVKVAVSKSSATYTCTVAAGGEYKVRCRAYRDGMYSNWSDYSSGVLTVPAVPVDFTDCRASSETSVYVAWSAVKTATSYELQYAQSESYFTENAAQQITSQEISEGQTNYTATGLESGKQYYFRLRAKNSVGESGWSNIKSTVIGTESTSPTTWSSTTTVVVGEPLTLHWVHNSEDGSAMTSAILEVFVGEASTASITKALDYPTDEKNQTLTGSHEIDTSIYTEGTKLRWRVRTAGANKVPGEWSVERIINVYAKPTLEFSLLTAEGSTFDNLTMFPLKVQAQAGPNTQKPMGYHISVIANEGYETVDNLGNSKLVSANEEVYSQYFDTNDNPLEVTLSAGDVDLENNITYTVKCYVSMDSGLTAEESSEFTVSWADMEYEPNAEIGIDEETYSAYIRPFCEDAEGMLVEDVVLSVYRREFDGKFTELGVEIQNGPNSFITDPHPALDYARYRVVATSKTTGAVSYCDIPGYPVGGKAAIIQWDEEWSSFDAPVEDALEQAPWSGSMLILPYNIDVSDKSSPDVSLIKYIGREHPVSYYGTQVGETSTWSMEIAADDKETLYGLRRLQKWMGNVYVREPSGSGYWAHITVSFNQKHCEVTIPVTFEVTRVEGGA